MFLWFSLTDLAIFIFFRKAYAGLLQKFHVAHVEFERSLRTKWEEASDHWRKLRTTYALETFNKRIDAQEWSEPRDRMRALSSMRKRSIEVHQMVLQQISGLQALLPPHMSSKAMAAWRDATDALFNGWAEERRSFLNGLRIADDDLHITIQSTYETLQVRRSIYIFLNPQQT